MPTTKKTRRIAKHESRKETVSDVDNIDRAKQLAIIPLFGKIEFDPSYDYKTERRDRSGLKP